MGASCLGLGRPGSSALPAPTTRPFGRAAGAHYPMAVGTGVRAWGPVTNPTERAFASWLCALWGRHEGARGGGLLPAHETHRWGVTAAVTALRLYINVIRISMMLRCTLVQ